MRIHEVIDMLNRMRDDGVIETYAIGGAVGTRLYDRKRRLRLRLVALPIGEKLRMLNELRAREISSRKSAIVRDGSGISQSRLHSKRGKGAPRTQAEEEC